MHSRNIPTVLLEKEKQCRYIPILSLEMANRWQRWPAEAAVVKKGALVVFVIAWQLLKAPIA